MTAPEHDQPDSSHLLPTPLRDNGMGGKLRTGNPGNRGGRGRPKQRIVIAAGKDLALQLKRLKQAEKPDQQATCPKCGHEFKVLMVRGMDARTRIAYANLLANLQASDPDAGEEPTMIMVATGTPADMVASVTEGIEGVELVDGTQLEPPRDAGRRG